MMPYGITRPQWVNALIKKHRHRPVCETGCHHVCFPRRLCVRSSARQCARLTGKATGTHRSNNVKSNIYNQQYYENVNNSIQTCNWFLSIIKFKRIITVPADGLAPHSARPSAGTALIAKLPLFFTSSIDFETSSLTRWLHLTHWGRDKIDAISQTTFSSAFCWMKMYEFRLKFHWSLFIRVSLTIFQHWFR